MKHPSIVVTMCLLTIVCLCDLEAAGRGGPRAARLEVGEVWREAPLKREGAIRLRVPLGRVSGYLHTTSHHLVAHQIFDDEHEHRAMVSLFHHDGISISDLQICRDQFTVPGGLTGDDDHSLIPLRTTDPDGASLVARLSTNPLSMQSLFIVQKSLVLTGYHPDESGFFGFSSQGDLLYYLDGRGRIVATHRLSPPLPGLRDGVVLPSGDFVLSGIRGRFDDPSEARVGWVAVVTPTGRTRSVLTTGDRTARGSSLASGGMDLLEDAFGLKLAFAPADDLPHVIQASLQRGGRHPVRRLDRFIDWSRHSPPQPENQSAPAEPQAFDIP